MDYAASHITQSCYLELRKFDNIRIYISIAATQQFLLSFFISQLNH